MEIEDVPLISWSPDELHLDPNAVARLTRIQQLPALTANQPFGVFILTFEGGRLPVGAVRRVVNRLIRKKRTQSSSARSLWDLHDLIFFCQSHAGLATLHIVSFRETDNVPVMKVISWDTQATDNRIRLITIESLAELTWPGDGGLDPEAWREHWTTAFSATYRQGIRTAAALAIRMAEVAKVVRDEVKELFEVETDDGPLKQLYADVRNSLRADLTPDQFADMYAQTMVYGLLTARITHPEDFHADAINSVLKFENPFLDALYSSFRLKGDRAFDVDEFGLHELTELLAQVDVEQLLADFGVEERKDDPVVFFYEAFLERYDPGQRVELGAFYTPIPVVRCIIRGVDHLIKTEFGLPDGVADRTTWEQYSPTVGIPVPSGVNPVDPVIRMIDPATGTGTFLLEWLRQGMSNLASGPSAPDDNNAALVRQMDAFEISLSSYAVAQLKTSLELPPELRVAQHLGILLTDTLAGRRNVTLLPDDPISEEGQKAELIKFDTRHSICVGNPPYRRVDRQSAGGWISHPPTGGHSLFDDIHEPARKHTIFSHQASLFNLYVYFWRWAIWKVFEQTPSGPGIVGFVTASSWLNGPGFLGLRQLVRELVDDVYVIDLGGDNLGTRTNENIFPIQTPVAIVLLARRSASDRSVPARTRYAQIIGTRRQKLRTLDGLDIATVQWADAPSGWHAPFTPASGGKGWQDHPALIDLFPWQQPGCKFGRTWPIAPDPAVLEARWRRLVATENPVDRAKCFVTARTGRNITTKVADLPQLVDLPVGAPHHPIARYGFRSFDRQWAIQDPRLAALERPALWASLGDQQIFMTTLTTAQLGAGPASTATTAVPDLHYFHGRGGKDVIPLYRDADGTPNADRLVLDAITAAQRSINSDAPAITVERLFAYVYGVLAGSDYTDRFSTELSTPGPRVPLSCDSQLFAAMADHGERLLWLHTYGERFRATDRQELTVDSAISWSAVPTRIPVDSSQFEYDSAAQRILVADGHLQGVTPEVWTFEVSGMQVVRKWLGYRTAKGAGRATSSSSPLDQIRPNTWTPEWSVELRELVHVLAATLVLQGSGQQLLNGILAGDLCSASALPMPSAALRQPPLVAQLAGGMLVDVE
jgi:hypothetical protein